MAYPVKHFESSDAGAPTLDRTQPGSLITVLKHCLITGYNLQPVSSLEMEGGKGRANFSGSHNFRLHQIVLISGAADAAWNGEHRVTAMGNQWITFDVEGEPAAESGSGIEIKTAPAGSWEIAHINTEETRAAFRSTDPASTRMFWYLDDRRSADIEESPTTNTSVDFRLLRGAEGMPDLDTREQSFGDGYLFIGTSSQGDEIPYDIIADGRTVYLITHPVSSSGEYRTVHAFGDFFSHVPGDPYAAMTVLAQYSTTSTTSGDNGSAWGAMSSTSRKRLARECQGIFRDVPMSISGSSVSGTLGGGGFDYPNAAGLELLIHKPLLIREGGGTTLHGIVPGVAQPLHAKPLESRDVVDVAGTLYKAITHSAAVTTNPGEAQTFFDLTGPWT